MDGGEGYNNNLSSSSGSSLTSTTTSLSSSMEKLMISPKSPLPGFVDFHGKRKQMVKIQVLEREIGMLQEELKSLEGLQPASRCCKELDAFVGSISDPFTPTKKQKGSESHHFRKHQICFPWACCSCCCLLHKKMAKCCCGCCSSSKFKCCCCSCLKNRSTCTQNCC